MTKEELNKLKEEYEALDSKLKELSKEELEIITGGHGKNEKPTNVLWDTAGSSLDNKSREEDLGGRIHADPTDEHIMPPFAENK